jgi:hypothetical protein
MQASEVSIIGGGFSAKNVDLAALPGTVIAVNDAALLAPKVDIAVSMDRLWIENRWDRLQALGKPAWLRLSAMFNMLENVRLPWVNVFEGRNDTWELGRHTCSLNGPNSGHCALNLALLMEPKKINLVGFDMGRGLNGETYWFPPYEWAKATGGTSNKRYAEWNVSFEKAIEYCWRMGVKVDRIAA